MRADLLARLADLPGAGSNPTDSERRPARDSQLPRAVVWITGEAIIGADKGDGVTRRIDRQVDVTVSIQSKPDATAAMVHLENMLAEVEARMVMPFETRPFEPSEDFLSIEEDREGAVQIISASLAYTITYRTEEGNATDLAI